MGLFDYVTSEYELPGNCPYVVFQTKDLTCYMERYTVTKDGRLVHQGKEDWSKFTGSVDLYASNIIGSGPGLYTRDGSDARSMSYRLVFVDGRVTHAELVADETEPATTLPDRQLCRLTPEERDETDRRQRESLLGRTVIVWWGGGAKPYKAEVVHENDRSWVLESDRGRLEIVSRSHRDSTVFDSLDDGQRYKDQRSAEWKAERAEFERQVAAKRAAS